MERQGPGTYTLVGRAAMCSCPGRILLKSRSVQFSTRELSLYLHTRKPENTESKCLWEQPSAKASWGFTYLGRENPLGCSTLSPRMPQGDWFAHRDTLLTLYRPLCLPTSLPTSLPVLPVTMSQIHYLTLKSLPQNQLPGKPSYHRLWVISPGGCLGVHKGWSPQSLTDSDFPLSS